MFNSVTNSLLKRLIESYFLIFVLTFMMVLGISQNNGFLNVSFLFFIYVLYFCVKFFILKFNACGTKVYLIFKECFLLYYYAMHMNNIQFRAEIGNFNNKSQCFLFKKSLPLVPLKEMCVFSLLHMIPLLLFMITFPIIFLCTVIFSDVSNLYRYLCCV